jgi:hypothetical protein
MSLHHSSVSIALVLSFVISREIQTSHRDHLLSTAIIQPQKTGPQADNPWFDSEARAAHVYQNAVDAVVTPFSASTHSSLDPRGAAHCVIFDITQWSRPLCAWASADSCRALSDRGVAPQLDRHSPSVCDVISRLHTAALRVGTNLGSLAYRGVKV